MAFQGGLVTSMKKRQHTAVKDLWGEVTAHARCVTQQLGANTRTWIFPKAGPSDTVKGQALRSASPRSGKLEPMPRGHRVPPGLKGLEGPLYHPSQSQGRQGPGHVRPHGSSKKS